MIEINNVFFSCKNTKIDEKIVLNNINLSIQSGESILLAGNTGSGKTSLLKTISSDIAPLVGSIKINDHNIFELSREEIFKTIALISGKLNDFILDDFTFIDNIYLYTMYEHRISPIFTLDKTRKLEIIDSIKALNLDINIDEIANKKLSELPSFYKHILILMIGILRQPKILLIDDVFSEIDGNDIEHVFPVLNKICSSHKFTTLITTNNPYLVDKICDRVIILSDGKILLDEKSGNSDNDKIIKLFNNHFHEAINKKIVITPDNTKALPNLTANTDTNTDTDTDTDTDTNSDATILVHSISDNTIENTEQNDAN